MLNLNEDYLCTNRPCPEVAQIQIHYTPLDDDRTHVVIVCPGCVGKLEIRGFIKKARAVPELKESYRKFILGETE